MKNTRFEIPEILGKYINIYSPKEDIYEGEDTNSFKKGQIYKEWITNDFSVIKEENEWHMVGITHPRPKGFVDDFEFGEDVHEAEYQLFHCVAKGDSFGDVFYKNSFNDSKKILYPHERAGEKPEIWAPHLMKVDGKYKIIYSPKNMRLAESKDFKNWETGKVVFSCVSNVARDPYVYYEDGVYYCIYTEERELKYRTSSDFDTWSEEKILQNAIFNGTENESPFMMKRNGVYYLFWSICNGENGCYDNRTLVFASKTIEGFRNTAPITMIKAHAPEIVTDSNGDTYILSVFYPENGVNAAKLIWR